MKREKGKRKWMRENLVFRAIAKAWLLWACESEYITLTRTHSYTQRQRETHAHAHPYERANLPHHHTHTHQYEWTSPSPLCMDVMLAKLPMCRHTFMPMRVCVCACVFVVCMCAHVCVSECEVSVSEILVHRKLYAGGDKRYGSQRDGTLCSSIDRHTECYILCENFALEIIIVLRTDAKWKKKIREKYVCACKCECMSVRCEWVCVCVCMCAGVLYRQYINGEDVGTQYDNTGKSNSILDRFHVHTPIRMCHSAAVYLLE